MVKKSEIVVNKGKVYHLGLRPGQIADQIILVGDPARAHIVASFFDEIQYEVGHREYVTLTGTYQGQSISVIGTGMSTDNIEICLMELYTLLAFDLSTALRKSTMPKVRIIRVGTSGGVQPKIAAGTIAISSYGLGFDSTGLYFQHEVMDPLLLKIEEACTRILSQNTPSYHRFHGKLFAYASKASSKIHDQLAQICQEENLNFVSGITATTPGFYGPSARYIDGVTNTIDEIKHHLAELKVGELQIVNMDMESSLLFHLGDAIGFDCGTICPIISQPGSSNNLIDYGKSINDAIKVALKVLIH